MKLKLISDYKSNDNLRLSFNRLAGKVFGIDFEKWYSLGFWNDRYICYSFADGSDIVSNVSASRLDIVSGDSRIQAVQIGTVMTHPDYRNMGLAGKLMKMVLEEYENKCGLIFLFGNKNAALFYPKFGFVNNSPEAQFYSEIPSGFHTGSPVRRLNMDDPLDIGILKRLAAGRYISRSFGVDHAESILAWHCLNVFPEDIYYIAQADTIAIYKIRGEVMHLYDVISAAEPDLRDIVLSLAPQGVSEIIFHFTPAEKDGWIKSRAYEPEDYIFFVKPEFRFPEQFYYPYTAHA